MGSYDVPPIEMISVIKLPSVIVMPHGGGTTIVTSKLKNLRTLGPNEEAKRISLVRVLTGYLVSTET